MILLTIIILINLFLGALMFLLMCANPNDPGILGKLNRFFFTTVSSKLITLIKFIFGEMADPLIESIKKYFDKGNHPLFQIIYLVLALGGYLAFSIFGIAKVMINDYTSISHPISFVVLGFLALWSYYKACKAKPGKITIESVDMLIEKYRPYYDGLIYKKNNKCKTCNFIKPARSKHCTVCNICVQKFDHHCTWIRQCVGQHNFKQFLLYLFWNAFWLATNTILALYDTNQYLKRVEYCQAIGIENIFIFNFKTLQMLFHHQTLLAFLLTLGVIGSMALVIFFFHQLWLVSKGLTSNERIKKNEYISFFQSEIQISIMLKQKFTEGLDRIQYRDKIMTKTEVLDTLQQYKRRKADLQRSIDQSSFWKKIYQILRK